MIGLLLVHIYTAKAFYIDARSQFQLTSRLVFL